MEALQACPGAVHGAGGPAWNWATCRWAYSSTCLFQLAVLTKSVFYKRGSAQPIELGDLPATMASLSDLISNL